MALEIAAATLPEPVVESEPEDVPLADHEREFGPNVEPLEASDATLTEEPAAAIGEPPVAQEKPKGRHRAKSQQATPADVPRIAELTKNWREAQAKIAELEAKLNAPPAKSAPPAEPAAFTDAEPTLEQFAKEPDPYLALARAQAAFDRRKEAAEAAQQSHTAARTAEEKATNDRVVGFFNEKHKAHTARMDAYIKANPEAVADFQAAASDTITPVMAAAVALLDDQSASALHTLVKHQDLRDELVLQTLGRQITPQLVEIVQRRLVARMQAAPTGSAAPASRPVIVPRPPNPVRTTPSVQPDQPPGDHASLAEHERYYGPRRRR
jgi:hypothetical protein